MQSPIRFYRRALRAGQLSTFRTDSIGFADHFTGLKQIVGANGIFIEDADTIKYRTDWTHSYCGGKIVVKPNSTDQVSEIVKYCSNSRIGVVPQGGNTSLCGGATPMNEDDIVISMERMNRILKIDGNSALVICEAGCILETLNAQCEEVGYVVPLDLGAKGSCQIGGNIATNAGGLRVIKFGSLFQNVIGLEVVLPDGTVLNMMRELHKDNSGYHLMSMFIGSEGTLGVITRVVLQLKPKPVSRRVLLGQIASFAGLDSLLAKARAQLGEVLSAVEFMDQPSVSAVLRQSPDLLKRLDKSLWPGDDQLSGGTAAGGITGPVWVLIECSSSSALDNVVEERLSQFSETLMASGELLDAVMSQDDTQSLGLWAVRENVPTCLMALSRLSPSASVSSSSSSSPSPSTSVSHHSFGKLFKYDVSLSLENMNRLVLAVQQHMQRTGYAVRGLSLSSPVTAAAAVADCQTQDDVVKTHYTLDFCNFGHAGDQNLHLNILVQARPLATPAPLSVEQLGRLKQLLDHAVYSQVLALRGSVSAEHGIGQAKTQLLTSARSPEELSMMTLLKRSIDPRNIMNPGKVVSYK